MKITKKWEEFGVSGSLYVKRTNKNESVVRLRAHETVQKWLTECRVTFQISIPLIYNSNIQKIVVGNGKTPFFQFTNTIADSWSNLDLLIPNESDQNMLDYLNVNPQYGYVNDIFSAMDMFDTDQWYEPNGQ